MTDRETGYAKLNLALHVRGRRPDGYHELETLFAFCEDGDVLAWGEAPGVTVTGPFASDLDGAKDDNLVMRAARAFAARFGTVEDGGFTLDKRLPVASGIGGGSADAAAALRLLGRRHGIEPADPRLTEIAAALGADVPACLLSRPMRGTARGDCLASVPGATSGLPVLLVNPRLPLSTGAVFARWDGIDRGPLAKGDALDAADAGRNDLEAPATKILGLIGEILALLRGQGEARLVRMSGSGASCFALFRNTDARDAASRAVAAAAPSWWRLATRLR